MVGGFERAVSDGGLAVYVGCMQVGRVDKLVGRLVVDQRIMGAQLGHNSLGEAEVEGGKILGKMRGPLWSCSTDGGVSWLVFPGVARKCKQSRMMRLGLTDVSPEVSRRLLQLVFNRQSS